MARTIRNANLSTAALAASTLISQAKLTASRRLVLEISNLEAAGGNDLWISIDEEAKTLTGRRIQPGQTITWSQDGGYTPPQGQVNGMSAAAVNMAIYEEIETL